MDHWLDQRFGMDRPRCIRWLARESAHRGSHILHARELRAAALAPISDLYWLQSLRILAQRFRQFTTSLRDKGGFRMVDHWIRYHFYHCPGMLLSKLRKRQIRFRHLH